MFPEFQTVFAPGTPIPPRGIYPLAAEATWARCGCGSYRDGTGCTSTTAQWLISYGPACGAVYACDKHAEEKRRIA